MKLVSQPIYDPAKSYEENFNDGPFGEFVDPEIYQNQGEPKYTFLGYPVHEPFGIPAGPLLHGRYVTAAFAKGFDVVCYKTQRSTQFDCNSFPNVLYVDVDGDLTLEKAREPLVGRQSTDAHPHKLTITNSFGNPSKGPQFWVPDVKQALDAQAEGQILIKSVVGTIKDGFSSEDYYDDFAEAAKMAADAGVKAIEVNLSCPNVASEGVLCYTPQAVAEICRRVKQQIGEVPLIAKLGYFSAAQNDLLETIVREMVPYVGAISSINTIAAPVVNEHGEQALPGEGRLKSGMCGASIKWAGLDMVKRLDGIRKRDNLKYEIIGVGGVMTPSDYQEYRSLGADCVMSATGAMWNPNLAIEIKQSTR